MRKIALIVTTMTLCPLKATPPFRSDSCAGRERSPRSDPHKTSVEINDVVNT
jgi:hypothetical protein